MTTDDDQGGAFSRLYTGHHRSVLAYALRRCANPSDAEDAASETFVVAWRRISDVPPEAVPWLYGICRRVIANQRRSVMRRMALRLRLIAEPTVVEARVGEPVGAATAALRRLGPDDQELLRLIAWEEMSHGEAAIVLGITPNAVAIRLHRARQRFAAALDPFPPAPKGSLASRTQIQAKGAAPGRPHEERPL
ncbi:MAG: sigma-70 family RNA polymerase sigma factor [Candidatus Limnocylindrales bacterium]